MPFRNLPLVQRRGSFIIAIFTNDMRESFNLRAQYIVIVKCARNINKMMSFMNFCFLCLPVLKGYMIHSSDTEQCRRAQHFCICTSWSTEVVLCSHTSVALDLPLLLRVTGTILVSMIGFVQSIQILEDLADPAVF